MGTPDRALEDCRAYRALFRFVPRSPRGHWIEPRAGAAEVARFRQSSALAAYLVERTFADAYRDAEAASPRPPDPEARIDLGLGGLPAALAALPDIDGDGVGELASVVDERLWLLLPDSAGRLKSKRLLTDGDVALEWRLLSSGERPLNTIGTHTNESVL